MDPYDFALKIAKDAGALLLAAREHGFKTSFKGADTRDVVTSVDFEVNNFLTQQITAAFPEHAIYSEEGGGVSASSHVLWVLDPIDGSANFSRGIPHFAVSIGLLDRGTPILGAVYNPVAGELFSFQKGRGARLNGVPIRVALQTDLSKAHVFFHAGRGSELRDWGGASYRCLLERAHKTSNFSCVSLDTCFVAAGRVEASVYGFLLSTLDCAPALGMLREAGGVVEDEEKQDVPRAGSSQKIIMANNAEMLKAVRRALS